MSKLLRLCNTGVTQAKPACMVSGRAEVYSDGKYAGYRPLFFTVLVERRSRYPIKAARPRIYKITGQIGSERCAGREIS